MWSLNHRLLFQLNFYFMSGSLNHHMKYLIAFIKITSLDNLQPAIPIVTDDEKAVCNAMEKTLSEVVRVSCWNHIINSAKLWHGAEISVYQIYENSFISQHIRIILTNLRVLGWIGVKALLTTMSKLSMLKYVRMLSGVCIGVGKYTSTPLISWQKHVTITIVRKFFCIEFMIYFDIVLTR